MTFVYLFIKFMNRHNYVYSEITQQNSTTQCGPWADAGQNLPLRQSHRKYRPTWTTREVIQYGQW